MPLAKVVQVLTHSEPSGSKVDPRFDEGDWHFRVAKELIKRINEFTIECWRQEVTLKKIFIRKSKDGILVRNFPLFFFKPLLEVH
ncbi:MAG: hypothetical protein QXI58_03435 [Candidatus Micrarchaeia archaeon]